MIDQIRTTISAQTQEQYEQFYRSPMAPGPIHGDFTGRPGDDHAVGHRVGQAHRGNVMMVEQIETEVDGSYVVVLRGGRHVPVSRRQSRRLRETLSL
jgi:LytTr DNA-binding domain-containing protein